MFIIHSLKYLSIYPKNIVMNIEVYQEPFPYLHFVDILPLTTINQIISELNNASSWLRVKNNLYELDVLNKISSVQTFYKDPNILNFLNRVSICVKDQFDIDLERKVKLHIHRFTEGTGISLHTDSTEKQLRLLIFLKPLNQFSQGGQLLLANRTSGKTKLILPNNNTGLLLTTHLNWLHAVTEQIEGTRYSMVFQLFQK